MNGNLRLWSIAVLLAALVPTFHVRVAAQSGTATLKGEKVELIYPRDTNEEDVRSLAEFLSADRATILKQLGLESEQSVRARTYESVNRFLSEAGLKQPWRGAHYSKGTLHIQPIQALIHRRIYESALTYEMAYLMLEPVSAKGCPRWLREAYAVHHSGVLATLTPAVGASLSSFSDLDQDIQENPNPPGRDDVQFILGSTMKFLNDRFGQEKTFALFKEFDGKSTVETVFKRVLEEPYSSIERAWVDHIRSISVPVKAK